MSYSIYCDMDGVLVNLHKGINDRLLSRYKTLIEMVKYDMHSESPFMFKEKLYLYYVTAGMPGPKAWEKAREIFWSVLDGDSGFWTNLEWMSDGEELFKYCLSLRERGLISELNILSSPSGDIACVPGKEGWLKRVGIYDKFDRVIFLREKYKECRGSFDILIDDTDVQINGGVNFSGWLNVGGTGILHTSTSRTLERLKTIIDK